MPLPFKDLLKDGVLSFYVQVHGPRTFRIIKMAMDTGASYTIIPIKKFLEETENIANI